MLGAYGEVHVIDWGVARTVGEAESIDGDDSFDPHLGAPVSGYG